MALTRRARKFTVGAARAVEEGKTGLEKLGKGFGDVVKTVEEVGREIGDHIKEIFDGGVKGNDEEKPVAAGNKTEKTDGAREGRGEHYEKW